MYSLLLLGITSLLASLLLTPIVRDLGLRFGLVDTPNDRKIHGRPIPRLGGVAILAATLISYGVLILLGLNGVGIVRSTIPLALKLLLPMMIICGVGLADDIFNLSAWYKLIAQLAAAIVAWSVGLRLESMGGHPFTTVASLSLTVLWIVACTNAINLIDGVDGLAAGAGLIATLTMLIAGGLHGNMALVFAITPVAAALLGFLRFNFIPASIFLGDCGSLGIGFLLGCFGIVWSEKAPTLLGMTAPLFALSVPLLDTVLSIGRRFLHRKPIFGADRLHIHHKLLSRGLNPRRVVILLYAFCGVSAGTSLLLTELHPRYQSIVILFVCLVAAIALGYLDYTEFRVAGRMVLNGRIRRLVADEIDLDLFARELATVEDFDKCWDLICGSYRKYGFSQIELYGDRIKQDGTGARGWHVRIDFHRRGYMRLLRSTNTKDPGASALLFIDCLACHLGPKLDEFAQVGSPKTVEFVPAKPNRVTFITEERL
jgi:UDP-GlcNAc:undecaprenyl-phosphate GlcNAc-1-phosphate transferase